jgi:hypothetical protein
MDWVEAYLRNQEQEQADDYRKRGRKLAAVETEHLKQQWVDAFKRWAAGNRADHRVREDIQAELLIRGHEVPFELVQGELAALKATSRATDERLFRDPARLARADAALSEEVEAFRRKSRSSN